MAEKMEKMSWFILESEESHSFRKKVMEPAGFLLPGSFLLQSTSVLPPSEGCGAGKETNYRGGYKGKEKGS